MSTRRRSEIILVAKSYEQREDSPYHVLALALDCGPSTPKSTMLLHPRATWLRARTSKAGTWTIPHLEPGRYRFAIQLGRYCAHLTPEVAVTRGKIVKAPTARLAKAGILTGVIMTKAGKPDPKATVLILCEDRTLSISVATDKIGTFTVDRLPEGSYRIVVPRREGMIELITILNAHYQPTIVKIEPGKTHHIKL